MLKLVIVEDEDIIRRGLIETIDWQEMGAEVRGSAADGEEALAVISKVSPDVVLTDVRMPVMDGLELARKLQEIDSSIQVIFLTSHADFEYAREAMRLHVDDYLLKPVDEDELSAVMKRLAEERGETSLPFAEELALAKRSQNPYVRVVMEVIEKNWQQRISLEPIADKQQVSVSYLSRKLKEETENTFSSLLAKYRLQQSIVMLKEGTWRIYEVAEECGFSDYKNFCQVFKKYLGMAPGEMLPGEGRKDG
jgi:two-component system response regulator YesN